MLAYKDDSNIDDIQDEIPKIKDHKQGNKHPKDFFSSKVCSGQYIIIKES